MNRQLKDAEIEYVMYHLGLHVTGIQKIRSFLRFDLEKGPGPAILMPLSDRSLCFESVVRTENDIPVLFPLSETSKIWTLSDGGTLVFHHDILKSAFFLLSSRWEWEHRDRVDAYGRFDYDWSVQKRLSIIDKPVVNYYFSLIISGWRAFALQQGFDLEVCQPYGTAGLMITHDVDRLDYYSWRSVVFRSFQWAGLKPREAERKVHFKMMMDAINRMVVPAKKRDDPYWSFNFFRDVERTHGFLSCWYFLNRDGSAEDAPYRLCEKRVRTAVDQLRTEECEVGFHGSFKSSESAEGMNNAIDYFKQCFGFGPAGGRQHFLKGRLPELYYHERAGGLKYDAGFGFSAHEGFRNSYCWPFKPFDHEKQEMISFVVLPMVWMDTTLAEHRSKSLDEMLQVSGRLLNEVVKFNGLFNVLWHSCRTNEILQPGIKDLYRQLCDEWANAGLTSFTGEKVLSLIKE